MISVTLTVRLTAAEAAEQDGLTGLVDAIGQEQLDAVIDAVNGVAYVSRVEITPAHDA